MRPLEVRIASTEGIDVDRLISAISSGYCKESGRELVIRKGDGREAGYLFIEEKRG